MSEFSPADAVSDSGADAGGDHSLGGRGGDPRASDRMIRFLGWSILAVALALITFAGYVVIRVTGLQPPRTYLERQLDVAELATKASPDAPKAFADYAAALTAARQYSKAQSVLADALDRMPNSPELMLQQAHLYLARGQDDKAIEWVDKTLKSVQDIRQKREEALAQQSISGDVTVWYSDTAIDAAMLKAAVLYDRKDYEGAITMFNRALQEDPQQSDVRSAKADAEVELGRFDAAIRDYKQALQFIPDFQPALDGLKRAEEGAKQ